MKSKVIRVTEVVDGDTFLADAKFAGAPTPPPDEGYPLRIKGYDAPERGEPGYEKAKARLARLVQGKKVTIVYDPDFMFDVYDRLLARVYYNDRDVADLMKKSS